MRLAAGLEDGRLLSVFVPVYGRPVLADELDVVEEHVAGEAEQRDHDGGINEKKPREEHAFDRRSLLECFEVVFVHPLEEAEESERDADSVVEAEQEEGSVVAVADGAEDEGAVVVHPGDQLARDAAEVRAVWLPDAFAFFAFFVVGVVDFGLVFLFLGQPGVLWGSSCSRCSALRCACRPSSPRRS